MSDSTREALLARVRDGDLRLHELEDHTDAETAAAVDLDAGAVRLVDQGPDPRSFDPSDCP